MARLDSMLWFRPEEVPAGRLDVALSRLTIQPPPDYMTEAANDPIYNWKEKDGEIGVPINFGLDRFSELKFDDNLSLGEHKIPVRKRPDPKHPKAQPGQEKFFNDVIKALEDNYTVLACAPTGSGKTVTALNAIGEFSRPALIIVPSNVLADQWQDEAVNHLGLDRSEIGSVGAGKEDWKGKYLVTVVLHNLFLKEYSEEFYRYFGFVCWDECHRLGAAEFSKTMPLFHASYKLAVSATPKRKDGCDDLVFNYFGPVRVNSKQEGLGITCYNVSYPHYGVRWIDKCRSDVKGMQYLARLEDRNAMLVKLGVRFYDEGRNGLFLTRFNEHVHRLSRLLAAEGIPWEDIGQFCGVRVDEEGNETKNKQSYLKTVKESCPIIVATYAMMKEGVDIPRIDAGVEALPIADGIQAIGRARRPHPDKPDPIWFSITDTGINKFQGYARARLRGYENDGNITLKKIKYSSI